MLAHPAPADLALPPDALAAFSSAYGATLDALDANPLLKSGLSDEAARAEVAVALARKAETGETNAARLSEDALFHLASMADPAS